MDAGISGSFGQRALVAVSMAASALGLQSGAQGEEPLRPPPPAALAGAGEGPKEAQGAELVLPKFAPMEVSGDVLNTLREDPRLGDLIQSVEPHVRGQKVVIAVVAPDGKVLDGREIEFPTSKEENTKILWGMFVAGLAASATLSGLTIGLFSVSKLQLTLLAEQGNEEAKKILGLRDDANTVLSTLIWGNVGLNVLISKVGDQLLSGSFGPAGAALFSIGALTLFGEILPQAYFTQNVLKAGARLEPVVRALRTLLYPVAKPSGLLMDRLVGREGIEYYTERQVKDLLRLSAEQHGGETSKVEARGASNFLDLDDVPVFAEGELLSPASILKFPMVEGKLSIPKISPSPDDPVLRAIQDAQEKWVVLCDDSGEPQWVLDADSFLRDVLFEPEYTPVHSYWHKPIVVRDEQTKLGEILSQLAVSPEHREDDVIDHDTVLVWTPREKRIITGSDLFGRLMRGIARVNPSSTPNPDPTALVGERAAST